MLKYMLMSWGVLTLFTSLIIAVLTYIGFLAKGRPYGGALRVHFITTFIYVVAGVMLIFMGMQ